MENDTELVFDFELNVFKSFNGLTMHYPFINIEGQMIHDDELKGLLKSDKMQDKERRNALVTTIIEGNYRDVFKYILLCGYNLDEILNDKGQTALHLAFHNNPGSLFEPNGAFLVPSRTSNINYTDSDGLTHLHIACVIGSTDLVKQLLENKSTNVNADYQFDKGDFGRGQFKPLHFAVLNVRLDIVKILLENGADVHATDFLGRTPLHIATGVSRYRPSYSWVKDWRIVDILLKYQSKVNALDNNGNTPLLSIYENYFQHDYNLLYRVYINDMEYQESEHMEVDLVKAQSKKIEILIKHGADVSVSNKNGDNIIHCVINNLKTLRNPSQAASLSFNDTDHTKMIKNILNADSNLVDVLNAKGESPLLLAVSYLSLDIVKTLLKFNADLKSLKFDNNNPNFFQYLCIVPNFEPVKNLISIKKLLLSKGYNVSVKDNLVFLRFLKHDFDDCNCGKARDSCDIIFKIMNLLNFGSTAHIENVLKALDNNVLVTIEDSFNYLANSKLLTDFINYLKYMEYANLYLDQETKKVVQKLYGEFELPKITFDEPASELRRMKSKKLKSKISLHKVMMMHPYDIYHYIKDRNFDYKCLKDFPVYENMIKGHFTRSIIRHHLEESVYEFMQKFMFPSLPIICLYITVNYLTNEDLFNIAIIISEHN